MKQKKKILIIFIIVVLNFSFLTKSFQGANLNNWEGMLEEEIKIAGKTGDILTYKWSIEDEEYYEKFNLTELSYKESELFLNLSYMSADSLDQFNETYTNSTSHMLNGTLSNDLFANHTFLSLFLPLHYNFTEQKSEFDGIVAEMNEDDRFNTELSVLPTGLGYKFIFYFKLVVFIKVMEIEAYYSTTRVLLMSRMKFFDPKSNDQGELIRKIVVNCSSFLGVNQNPYNPFVNETSYSNSHSNTDFEPFGEPSGNVKFDWKSITILSSVGVALIALPTGIIWWIKKKKQ
jgi:hypothetical protein